MKTEEKLRVLVVDDEPEILDITKEALESEGHTVFIANDGPECLHVIEEFDKVPEKKIQLVITDVRMPNMDGFSVARELKKKDIPTIIMTGHAEIDERQAEEIGACDFLKKPFGLEELSNSLDLAVEQMKRKIAAKPADLDYEYCRLPIEFFIDGTIKAEDVFMRLAHDKYLRVARAGSPLTKDRLNSYKSKGLTSLYLSKEFFASYVGFPMRHAHQANVGREPLSRTKKLQMLRESAELCDKSLRIAVPLDLFNEAKVLTENTLHLLMEADLLFEAIEDLRNRSEKVFAHSLAVALYGNLLVKQIGWPEPEKRFKVTVAGIVHDLGRRELPEGLTEKRRSEMSNDEAKLDEGHPSRGREFLMHAAFVSDEVIQAVEQHHEEETGKGFPFQVPGAKIQPIAKVLHLLDDFLDLCLPSPYGQAMPVNAAADVLCAGRLENFDPLMLSSLMKIMGVPVPEKLKVTKTASMG